MGTRTRTRTRLAKNPLLRRLTSPRLKRIYKAKEPPVKLVKAPRNPDEDNDKSGSGQRRDRAAPRSVSLHSVRPRSPEHGPRAHGPENERGGEADSKSGKYTCTVCGRQVGGGVAGDFQHRRSPFHLASWVWHNQSS